MYTSPVPTVQERHSGLKRGVKVTNLAIVKVKIVRQEGWSSTDLSIWGLLCRVVLIVFLVSITGQRLCLQIFSEKPFNVEW